MKSIHEIKTLVGYDGRHYIIIPDEAAGMRHRYSVYQIPASPSRRIKIIGRELDLKLARKLVYNSK